MLFPLCVWGTTTKTSVGPDVKKTLRRSATMAGYLSCYFDANVLNNLHIGSSTQRNLRQKNNVSLAGYVKRPGDHLGDPI